MGPADLETRKSVAREKGRKWIIDAKNKYFTGEGFTDAINCTLVHGLVYDDLGRPSERGGKLDLAFFRRPCAELSLVEYRYQLNMRTDRINVASLRDLGLSQKLYLLTIPNTAVVGDVIWALTGGQALYILRPMD